MLPPQRTLATLFEVNRSTIVTALEELSSFGILESHPGRGTRIASNTWSLLMSNAPPDWGQYLHAGSFLENVPTIQTINRLEFKSNIIRLGTGELSPDLLPQNLLNKSLIGMLEKMPPLSYVEPLGILELREVISERLKKIGIDALPSSILITSGSLQALQLISVGMINPGDVVYTEAPSYLKSLQVFQSAGIQLEGVPMDEEGLLYWKLAREGKRPESSLLYSIPSFHNPTGILMSEARRKELYRFCSENRMPVIEDDAYGELWLDEAPPRPLKSMDRNGMILYLGTVSKCLAPGLRIGWLVGPESVVQRLGDVKMQVDYGASSLSQRLLIELFRTNLYDEYIANLRDELKKRRQLTVDLLTHHFADIASWNVPKGGFYIWLKLEVPISTNKLFQEALKENILINPGSIYDFSPNRFVRISYSYASCEELEKGLITLADLIRDLHRKK